MCRFVNGVRDECVSVSRTTIRDILSVVIKVSQVTPHPACDIIEEIVL